MWGNLLLLLFLLQPAPPSPTAYWVTSDSARVSWEQRQRACLYREPQIGPSIFIGCYEGRGRAVVRLGGPLTDGNFRPRALDVYRVVVDGVTYRALLRGVVLLPMVLA